VSLTSTWFQEEACELVYLNAFTLFQTFFKQLRTHLMEIIFRLYITHENYLLNSVKALVKTSTFHISFIPLIQLPCQTRNAYGFDKICFRQPRPNSFQSTYKLNSQNSS